MRVIMSLLLLLWANSANAQDISKKMSLIAPGSTVVMKNSDGDSFTQLFLGKHGDHYVYQTFAGTRAKGEPLRTTYTLENGNEVFEVGAFGEVTRYEPHNCMRTLGKCRFVTYLPDSNGVRYRRQTKAVSGGFEFSLFVDKNDLVISGRAMLDKMGIAKSGVFSVPNGPGFSVRILRSKYK